MINIDNFMLSDVFTIITSSKRTTNYKTEFEVNYENESRRHYGWRHGKSG